MTATIVTFWFARRAATIAFSAATLIAASASTDARADCFSACDSSYYSCARSFNERDCATQRSICTNRCVMGEVRRYGAIAYSPSTGTYGTSWRYASRDAAEDAALQACRQSDVTDCEIGVYFYDRCGALAKGSDGAYGMDHGRTEAAAKRNALTVCQRYTEESCRIEVSFCSR